MPFSINFCFILLFFSPLIHPISYLFGVFKKSHLFSFIYMLYIYLSISIYRHISTACHFLSFFFPSIVSLFVLFSLHAFRSYICQLLCHGLPVFHHHVCFVLGLFIDLTLFSAFLLISVFDGFIEALNTLEHPVTYKHEYQLVQFTLAGL